MIYENLLIDSLKKYQPAFKDIVNNFRDNCTGNATSFDEWKKQREIVITKLDGEIEKITNSYFKNLVLKSIRKQKKTDVAPECDFAKFCYFIDSLNKEKFSKKIVRYNPNYCGGIVDSIAYEYLRIVSFIDNYANKKASLNGKEYQKAKSDLFKLWSSMFVEDINQIINKEFEYEIQEIKSQI